MMGYICVCFSLCAADDGRPPKKVEAHSKKAANQRRLGFPELSWPGGGFNPRYPFFRSSEGIDLTTHTDRAFPLRHTSPSSQPASPLLFLSSPLVVTKFPHLLGRGAYVAGWQPHITMESVGEHSLWPVRMVCMVGMWYGYGMVTYQTDSHIDHA